MKQNEPVVSVQQILDALDEGKIEAVVRKWFAHPFNPVDRAAGHRYGVSILQVEFARTQVFNRPLLGRHLFEEGSRKTSNWDAQIKSA